MLGAKWWSQGIEILPSDLPWHELLYDVPCLPIYIFCKWKLCSFSLLFSIIVMTSYFCSTNKYSKRKKVSFGVVLLHKFYLRVFLERLIALLENTLDGQLSLIWDLYHLRETTEKLDMGQKSPPFGRVRVSEALGPATATPQRHQNFVTQSTVTAFKNTTNLRFLWNKSLPKAQRTRGLSSYHKVTVHKSWTYNNFRISIKH